MLSIPDVVTHLADQYLSWFKYTKGGENINGPCPFHEESTAGAFYWHVESGAYFCHGCLARGNLVNFVRHFNAPKELLKCLPDWRSSPTHLRLKKENNDVFAKLTPIPEHILGLFEYCPLDLIDAGFDEQLIQEMDIGMDLDYGRITFPLRNHKGVLYGIAGRTIVGEKPKYLIYTQDDMKRFGVNAYSIEKKYFLWNLDKIYAEAWHKKITHIYIVEGYKAALWLIQNGFRNTVALLGVHMSNFQERLIARLGCSVSVLLDNTDAAKNSMLTIGTRLNKITPVTLIDYPDYLKPGAQPDDIPVDDLENVLTAGITPFHWRHKYGFRKIVEPRQEVRNGHGLSEKIAETRRRERKKPVTRVPLSEPFQTSKRLLYPRSNNSR